MRPVSCDTFVVLPPLTAHGGIIFGKNSDRPKGEVQELIYQPAQQHSSGVKLQVNIGNCISRPHLRTRHSYS
jgi:secernin